jgi:hypothetical protein
VTSQKAGDTPALPGEGRTDMRFLNQKLGKRTNRKFDLLKSRLQAEHVPKNSRPKVKKSKVRKPG